MTFRVQENSFPGKALFYDWNQILMVLEQLSLGEYLFCCGYSPVSVLGQPQTKQTESLLSCVLESWW